jgi:DNA-directed RNA polymerase subunit RPC12/RpoP
MVIEIPLVCSHCGKATPKSVEWVQENTFFTCECCGAGVLIDKDVAASFLAKLELRE